MQEVVILFVLALVWIVFATIQDIRKREVANWLNFSLIIFALGFRFFYSLFYFKEFSFFYQGLFGLGIFLILGNLLYYGRMFAGGDAKLMIALGAILPFSKNFFENAKFFVIFLLIFLFVGAVYGLIITLYLSIKNSKVFKKEFLRQIKSNKKTIRIIMLGGLVLTFLGIFELSFLIFGVSIFFLPLLYYFAKSVDEVCMVKKVDAKDLTEGDWLYEELRVGRKLIKPGWEGLSKKEIKLIQRENKKVKIRQGIAFVPVFLISFLILIGVYFSPLFKTLSGLF